MAASFKDIQRQAQKLAADERVELAQSLLDSVRESVADIESAWRSEIENRVAAYDLGETETFSAERVFAQARHLSH